MEEKKGSKLNFFVNILLGIIVLVFIIGCIWSVLKFNREHQQLNQMGYNEELINQIMNKQ